jgi:hypothetical protein
MFNDAVRKVRPPTLAEQLQAFSLEAEQVPEPASQEA